MARKKKAVRRQRRQAAPKGHAFDPKKFVDALCDDKTDGSDELCDGARLLIRTAYEIAIGKKTSLAEIRSGQLWECQGVRLLLIRNDNGDLVAVDATTYMENDWCLDTIKSKLRSHGTLVKEFAFA